jgi:membrane protein implicated in regulation of membrane protease activity
MDLLEHVPGGFVTVGILAALLVAVIAGFATKAIRLAAVGLALFLALGGWAFIEATSERAEDALERAKDKVEKIEDRVEDKVDALR